MRSIRAIQGGRHARINGQNFERLIDMACQRYKEDGKAWIEKTPEPMKPLGKQNGRGQFLACYTKQAQPDYKGTLRGGRAVVFEAKHTDADRIERSRVTDEQMEALRAHYALGAACFVLISFHFDRFYRVPFYVWEDMKAAFGKVSVNEKDLAPYLIRGGIMNFLGKTEAEAEKEAAEAGKENGQRQKTTDDRWKQCPECGYLLDKKERRKYCPACGEAVEWPE